MVLRRVLFAVFVLILTHGHTYGIILNYESSEDLANAKKFCPQYADDNALRDRDKAIQFYLAYLEEYPDTINRPKVLAHIGLIYTHYRDKAKGVTPDYGLAKKYFRESIESAPAYTYICYETVVARTNLVGLAQPRDERVRQGIETYKWLNGITEEHIEASVRAERANEKHLYVWGEDVTEEQKKVIRADGKEWRAAEAQAEVARAVRGRMRVIQPILGSVGYNLVYAALATPMREVALTKIMRELPGTPPARMAREKFEEMLQAHVDETILNDLGEVAPLVAEAEVPRPPERGVRAPYDEEGPEGQLPAPAQALPGSPAHSQKGNPLRAAIVVIFLVLILGAGYLAYRRRSARKKRG